MFKTHKIFVLKEQEVTGSFRHDKKIQHCCINEALTLCSRSVVYKILTVISLKYSIEINKLRYTMFQKNVQKALADSLAMRCRPLKHMLESSIPLAGLVSRAHMVLQEKHGRLHLKNPLCLQYVRTGQNHSPLTADVLYGQPLSPNFRNLISNIS